MAGKNFPAELIDFVIDFNHSDPEMLMNYALVSRQWTPSSRFHLFSTVSISHNDARDFIELLSSPYCTFASVVRGLDIYFVSGSQRWFSEFSRRFFLLDKTNITSLGISGSRNTLIRDEVQTALLPFAPQVKNLNFGPLAFPTFAEFAQLLCSFQALESLSSACTYQVTSPALGLQFTAPLRQFHLLLSPSSRVLFEFLLLQEVLPTIAFLSLTYFTAEDYPSLTRYLETPNTNLQSLTIKMDNTLSGITLDGFAEHINLTQLTALRELYIETNPKILPDQAFRLLAQITSTQLEILEITAALVQGVARLDILLSGDQFPSLKRVKILSSSWDDVRQLLPRCNTKNILPEI